MVTYQWCGSKKLSCNYSTIVYHNKFLGTYKLINEILVNSTTHILTNVVDYLVVRYEDE